VSECSFENFKFALSAFIRGLLASTSERRRVVGSRSTSEQGVKVLEGTGQEEAFGNFFFSFLLFVERKGSRRDISIPPVILHTSKILNSKYLQGRILQTVSRKVGGKMLFLQTCFIKI
jgi:hypothetical protein